MLKARVAELERFDLPSVSSDIGIKSRIEIENLSRDLEFAVANEAALRSEVALLKESVLNESDALARKLFLEEAAHLRNQNQQLESLVASLRSDLTSGFDKVFSQEELNEALQKQREKAFTLVSEKDRIIDDLKKKNAVLMGSSTGKGGSGPVAVSVSLPSTPTKAGNDSTQLQTLLDKIQQLQKRIVDMESSYKLQVDVLKTEVLELSREKRREGLNMGCVLCVQFCDSSQNASFCAVI